MKPKTVTQAADASFNDWLALLAGILGAFLAILDVQITNASLTQIEGAIGASLDEGSWISTAYLISEMIAIPLTAWLLSMLGMRRFLFSATTLFLLSSVGCGLSGSLNQLILYRVLQGITGGVLIPAAILIVRERIPQHQQPLGITIFSMVATVAPALGPTIGGWLTENLSWRYLFFINIGPGCLAILLQLTAFKKEPLQLGFLKRGDWAGILLMAVGFGCLTFILEEGRRYDWFESHLISGLTFLSAICLSSFIVVELFGEYPLVNLRLLQNRQVLSAAMLTMVFGITSFGALYLVPVYMAEIQGYGALEIGRAVMWGGIPQLFIAPFMPTLMRRVDGRILMLAGITLFSGSCFLTLWMTHDFGVDEFILPQLLRAMGQPLFLIPVSQMSISSVERKEAASASAISQVLRNLGGSIGIAMFATLLANDKIRHYATLSGHVQVNSPAVHDHLAILSGVLGGNDPWGRAVAALSQQVHLEAGVLAYKQVFATMGCMGIFSYAAVLILYLPKRKLRAPASLSSESAVLKAA